MVSNYIASVFEYLNKNVTYAVLRNFEGLPHNNPSRDIDIIIDEHEFKRNKRAITQTLLCDGWQLFSHLNNGRLITYVCAKITQQGNVEIVQWDLFVNTSVHGVVLASAQEMLHSRIFNGQLYHVSKEWAFLDKYLYNCAVGATYPARYQSTRESVEHSDIVRSKIHTLFKCNDTVECDTLSGQRLFYRALLSNLKQKPLSTINSIIKSWSIYLWQFITSPVAPIIAFTGADGVGKTTIIEMLQHRTSDVYGKATEYFHFRPLLIPNIADAAQVAGLKKDVNRDYTTPHRSSKKGVVSSLLRLCYYTIDYILGYWSKVKPHSKITKIILFDRYFSDIIVDSRRSSIYLSTKFLYLWSRLFIPRLRYNFLICASPEVILKRKQELDIKSIIEINSKMEYLSTKKGYYLIQNNGTSEDAVGKILSILISEQHTQNIKRI